MSDKGKEWPSEIRELRDERTGANIWQITCYPGINHHFYFLTCSFHPDETALYFAGFRRGRVHFFRAGFPDGAILQLTDAPDINSFSGAISADGKTLYFTRAGGIIALDLHDLTERTLADFPGGYLGEVDISSDQRWLVTAIREGRENGIVVCATDGDDASIILRRESVIIHPQFHPRDSNRIEFAADPAPRMHLIHRDGSGLECLYRHTNQEYVVHETWLGDSGDLVFVHWPYALKRMELPSKAIHIIAEFNVWHICPSRDGRYVLCDTNHPDVGLQLVEAAGGNRTTICYPQSSNSGSQWKQTRYAEKADFEAAAKAAATAVDTQTKYMDMKTDTVYGPQWTHPHPSFSPSHRYAAYTSDRSGHPQVYVVELPKSFHHV
ncbi:MAG: hypothetical protein C4527_06290 [Candidatus Omnitrophota bacterium]|jgi:hypothetical protein|nr:MAG: hypothetical protein C4527_06290 [Candidatus Omnitrophota bacterium]